jgi:OmpA-OmpF porin, OOP family
MHPRPCLFLPLVLGLALTPGARAQTTVHRGFAIDRFEPAERGSDWFVLESVDWGGSVRPSAGAIMELANRPLVLYDPSGDEHTVVIENQLFLHLGGALALDDTFRVAVNLPIALAQSGSLGVIGDDQFPGPDSATLGDLRLSGDLRVLGGRGRALSLAIGASVFLPTGSRDQYSGDGSVRLAPHFLAGGRWGDLQYAARLGFHYRAMDDSLDRVSLGSELTAAVAVGVRTWGDRLLLGPELYGSTVVSDSSLMFARRTTPIEVLLGGHLSLPEGWRIRGGVGVGVSRGLGSPAVRAIAGLEWTPDPGPAEAPSGMMDAEVL